MSCKLITQDPKDPTDYSVSYKLSLVLEIELIAETKPGTKPSGCHSVVRPENLVYCLFGRDSVY